MRKEEHPVMEEYPELDTHLCDSCLLFQSKYDTLLHHYFARQVYAQSLSNTKINAETKFFIKQLLDYIKCPQKDESCRRKMMAIRPVFLWQGQSVASVRLIDGAEFIDSTMTWKYDINLTETEKNRNYYIYFSNSPTIKTNHIRQIEAMSNCGEYVASHFYTVSNDDFFRPVFCSPHKLDLEYVSDTITDRLLREINTCENHCRGYCGKVSEQITFAKIRHLPNLYFTTDAYPDEQYPTRSVVLNIENKYALTIWKFGIGLEYCQCQ